MKEPVSQDLLTQMQVARIISERDSKPLPFGFLDGVASVPVVRSADSTLATASSGEPSPTSGMNMAQRILHVGGRNNAAGYVEFGSVQAVEALVRHVLRDLPQTAQEPVASADAIAFESAMKAGKGCDVWPAPGDYEKRTGRKLIALTFAVSAASPQPTVAPVELLCDIEPRPLRYPLSDYHRAMSDGPLHYTWEDKPHRLVYDLIAAVRYYASVPTQAVPSKDLSQTLWDNEAVMSLNAELGLTMDQLVKLARAMGVTPPQPTDASVKIGSMSDLDADTAKLLISKTISMVSGDENKLTLQFTDGDSLEVTGHRWDGCSLGVEVIAKETEHDG